MREAGAPIGVFDSGVGGLTVLRALRRMSPAQPVLYVADQHHVPYGDRDPAEVRTLALAITEALVAASCKAIVMACNISSATALDVAAERHRSVPIVGVVKPAVELATSAPARRPLRVGVLATQGTVLTGAYPFEIRRICPDARVVQVACPAFVPLIEQGIFDGPEVDARCRQYLLHLAEAGCERVILGCTHYPYLLPALQRVASALFADPPAFIDPADAAVERLARLGVLQPGSKNESLTLYTTGDAERFTKQVAVLMGTEVATVKKANWSAGRLVLPDALHQPLAAG